MCESYLVINNAKIDSSTASLQLIEKAHDMGFFDQTLKEFLYNSVKLRNRFTHDYYKRELSEKQIEEFCYSNIIYLEIFLESSKESVILTFKNTKA
ncbi:hypothetical protein [Clostridium peptidivorans]|uniref:hypothetical protein n=1 Tax=Clostridium peptidivorans TaxID=100174 RepID=UPI001FA884D5|nr:hypothetical protein [Clostridium peptidivorans]